MNFQQLRIVRETVRRNFNLTEVANSLFTSQSGVSRHIKDLEDELGVELFVRRGKRLLGLTDPGKEMVEIVERVLADTASIKRLGEQFSNRTEMRVLQFGLLDGQAGEEEVYWCDNARISWPGTGGGELHLFASGNRPNTETALPHRS